MGKAWALHQASGEPYREPRKGSSKNPPPPNYRTVSASSRASVSGYLRTRSTSAAA